MDVGFGTIWEAVNDRLPDVPAITEPGRTFSRAEFDDRASRLATAFADAGVGPGDTVACYLYNGSAYLETVFAAFKLGAVPINANYRYTGPELASLLADADARVLVFSASLAANVEAVAAQVPTLELLVHAGDGDASAVAGSHGLDELLTVHAPRPHQARPGTDRLFMYTGGTTGRPKGVIWQHGDLIHSIAVPAYGPLGRELPESLEEAVEAALDAHARGLAPTTMPVIPLMHGTGLFNTIGSLLVGGHIVFPPPGRLDTRQVWETVARHRVGTILVAGNAVSRPLLDELARAESEGRPHDLSSLRSIVSSGTAMSDEVKEEFHRRTPVTIVDAIASSEGGPFAFAITNSVDDLPSRFMPVPATKVFGNDDVEVRPGSGEVGVLSYCGPLPLGYHKDAAKSSATFRIIDGIRWSQPGDLVEVLPDGAIRFLGRGSGVINTGGEKVHPAEVEDALLSHPAVRDAVVVGVPDPTWGERVAAIVAVGTGSVTPEALTEHLRPQLAGYKIPRSIHVVDELPRTPTGKIETAWAKRRAAEAAG
ncbi:MAG TPA: AMP-binding protein [Blastococcus sp.]|nr:AMP-binding protein [Blastococcus sp.]